jgi:hypothetical protein
VTLNIISKSGHGTVVTYYDVISDIGLEYLKRAQALRPYGMILINIFALLVQTL